MSNTNKLPRWDGTPRGGTILEAGNARNFKTGDWRSMRPIWSEDKCVHCMRCWVFCPDSSILTQDGKMTSIDYDYCKGCGICSKECPTNAIAMISEDKAKEGK